MQFTFRKRCSGFDLCLLSLIPASAALPFCQVSHHCQPQQSFWPCFLVTETLASTGHHGERLFSCTSHTQKLLMEDGLVPVLLAGSLLVLAGLAGSVFPSGLSAQTSLLCLDLGGGIAPKSTLVLRAKNASCGQCCH